MFAIPNLLSFVSPLLWALGKLTAWLHHLKSFNFWLLFAFGKQPWQGMKSGRESMGHITSAPSWRSDKLTGAEWPQPASNRHLPELAWFLLLVPPWPLQVEGSLEESCHCCIISCWFPESCPWVISRPIIKIFLIAPFCLYQFSVRTPNESPISFNLYPYISY